MATSTVPLSLLAAKYNHPIGEAHRVISFTGRSGLSPLRDLPPKTLSRAQLDFRRVYQLYQEQRCLGFATYELEDLEAFAPTYLWPRDRYPDGGVDVSHLMIPLHPILSRSNWMQSLWEHLPRYPRGNEIDTYWEGADEATWNAFEPCLKLATMVLRNCQSLLWWQAFLDGDYEQINDDLLPNEWKGDQLRRFRRQRNYFNHDFVHDVLENFTRNYKVRFYLSSGWAEFTSGLPSRSKSGAGKFVHGESLFHEPPVDTIVVRLSYENLEPLLRSNLTGAERKLDTFRVAVTVLHELTHAMWRKVAKGLPLTVTQEPYFEDECVSELGFSMENAVFGGWVRALTETSDDEVGVGLGLSCAAIGSSSFLNWKHGKSSTQPVIPPKPADWEYDKWYPIPIGYFEDVWHPSFWHHARQFGDKTSHMGPKTMGVQRLADGTSIRVVLADSPSLLPEIQAISSGLNIERLASLDFENRREVRAIRIQRAAVHDYDERYQAQGDTWAPGPAHRPGEPGALWQGESRQAIESHPVVIRNSPRFAEIRAFLLANRAEGRLCLDTMQFEIAEYSFYRYIRRYLELNPDPNGFSLTMNEWVDFVRVCDQRGVLFRVDSTGPRERGITTIEWLAPPLRATPSLPRNRYPPRRPSADEMELFENVCLYDDWTKYCSPDVEFHYLAETIQITIASWKKHRRFNGPGISDVRLRALIDWEHCYGRLWRWGPNGLVRRRVDTFPSPGRHGPQQSGSSKTKPRSRVNSAPDPRKEDLGIGDSVGEDGTGTGGVKRRPADDEGGDWKRVRVGDTA